MKIFNSPYDAIALIISISFIINYINYKYVEIESAVFTLIISLLIVFISYCLGKVGYTSFIDYIRNSIELFQFDEFMLNGILGILLFSGAMSIDITYMKKQKTEILVLSTISVFISTILVAAFTYYIFKLFSINLSFIYCLLFGALISPTDPISILSVFKKKDSLPISFECLIKGESLFNDAAAIVLFISIYETCFSGIEFNTIIAILLFLKKVLGGFLFGSLLGYTIIKIIKENKNEKNIVIGTFAFVMLGYSISTAIGISAPISIVVCGIIVSYNKPYICITKLNQKFLEYVWEIIDELLNSILFVLMGFIIILMNFKLVYLLIAVSVLMILLFVRFFSIILPIFGLGLRKKYPLKLILFLTWGGIRGGLSIALSLMLPNSNEKLLIVPITYIVVIISFILQGFTINKILK